MGARLDKWVYVLLATRKLFAVVAEAFGQPRKNPPHLFEGIWIVEPAVRGEISAAAEPFLREKFLAPELLG